MIDCDSIERDSLCVTITTIFMYGVDSSHIDVRPWDLNLDNRVLDLLKLLKFCPTTENLKYISFKCKLELLTKSVIYPSLWWEVGCHKQHIVIQKARGF